MKRRSRARFLFEAIEGCAVLGASMLTWPLSKRWLRNWGSQPTERTRAWPGDELLSPNRPTNTRAIEIAAPASSVWPWIAQFGLDKAGFYSYELLERIAGIPVTNIESIETAMQDLALGDEVRLHPKVPGIPVAIVEPDRCVCFGELDFASREDGPDVVRSWSIYVEPNGEASCRLLVRGCFEQTRPLPLSARIAAVFEEPIDFAMEQRMLRTIKRLAEAN